MIFDCERARSSGIQVRVKMRRKYRSAMGSFATLAGPVRVIAGACRVSISNTYRPLSHGHSSTHVHGH